MRVTQYIRSEFPELLDEAIRNDLQPGNTPEQDYDKKTESENPGARVPDSMELRALEVIDNTVEKISVFHGINLDMDDIELTDQSVYSLIASGEPQGIYQLTYAEMITFMKDFKPVCFEDLMAGLALFRPGAMELIPKYTEARQNAELVTYRHPLLEPILKETYGFIVYQEQIVRILRDLAGYSPNMSDSSRIAMTKKHADVIAEERKSFVYGIEGEIPGCVNNGISASVAEEIFDDMIAFAKYAFNKSRAESCALIMYKSAWLKKYYPVEFMSALAEPVY